MLWRIEDSKFLKVEYYNPIQEFQTASVSAGEGKTLLLKWNS